MCASAVATGRSGQPRSMALRAPPLPSRLALSCLFTKSYQTQDYRHLTWRRRSRRPARSARKPRGGSALHSFRTLLQNPATVKRNVCRTNDQPDTRQTEFELDTPLSADQARTLELLKSIRF